MLLAFWLLTCVLDVVCVTCDCNSSKKQRLPSASRGWYVHWYNRVFDAYLSWMLPPDVVLPCSCFKALLRRGKRGFGALIHMSGVDLKGIGHEMCHYRTVSLVTHQKPVRA